MNNPNVSKASTKDKTPVIGLRIPQEILLQVEEYGKEHFSKGDNDYDKTATILALIVKGLSSDHPEQSVKHSVKHSVKLLEIKSVVEQTVKQLVEQELFASVEQIVKQIVKQDIIPDVEQLVKQLVKQGEVKGLIDLKGEDIEEKDPRSLWAICEFDGEDIIAIWSGKDWISFPIKKELKFAKLYTSEARANAVIMKLRVKHSKPQDLKLNSLFWFQTQLKES